MFCFCLFCIFASIFRLKLFLDLVDEIAQEYSLPQGAGCPIYATGGKDLKIWEKCEILLALILTI